MNAYEELDKIKFQSKKLSESLSNYDSTFIQFVIKYDLDEQQISDLYKIHRFKSDPNWDSFKPSLFYPNPKNIHNNFETGSSPMSVSYDELQKIKFHIRKISDVLDSHESRFVKLIIRHDFTEEQVEALHELFANQLGKTSDKEWRMFELSLYSFVSDPAKLVDEFHDANAWNRTCVLYKEWKKTQAKVEVVELEEVEEPLGAKEVCLHD